MPTQTINLNDALPAAPAGLQLNKWQADAPSLDPTVVRDVSTYTPLATLSLPGSLKPDGVGIGIDTSGKIFLLGNPLFYKGAWDAATLYNVGDMSVFAGEAYLCISQVDASIVPALIQSKATNAQSITATSNVTAGHLLVVYVAGHSNTINPSLFTLTDTLGTVYTATDRAGGGGIVRNGGALFYGVAPASGPCTITAGGFASAPALALAEFAGVTAIVNAHAAAVFADSVSLTTTRATMIVAGFSNNVTGDTFTGTGGIAVLAQSLVDEAIAIGNVAEGAAGTFTPGFSVTGADNSPLCIAAAFLDGTLTPDIDTAHWLCLGTVEPTGSGNKVIATPADGSSGQAALRVLVPADLPVATTAALGAVKPDGTSIAIAAGQISVNPATSSQLGGVKPDGTSITAAAGVISCARQVSTKTANYTATSTDNGKLLVFNSGSPVTLTLPVTVPANGWFIQVQNIGAGTLTVSPGSANLDGAGASLSITSALGTMIASDGTNYFSERGIGSASTGMSNPMTTLGDVIIGGAAGAPGRLGVGVDGYVLTSRSGATNGIDWEPSGGGGGGGSSPWILSLPASGWSWQSQNVNGSTNTIDTSSSQLTLTSNGGGDGLASYVRNQIAATFTISAALSIAVNNLCSSSAYGQIGIVVTDGTKCVAFGLLLFNGAAYLAGFRWTNATTPSTSLPGAFSNASGLGSIQLYPHGAFIFLRIIQTVSARQFLISTDGRNWIQVASSATSNTDFLTSTKYGVFIRGAGSMGVIGTCYSFTETNP